MALRPQCLTAGHPRATGRLVAAMAVLAVACSACSGSSRASAVREPGATSLGPGGAASGSASPSPGTVYVLAARSGRVLWSRHLADPVPSRDLPCGDISPVVGITGTPVIDLAGREIFVDADTLVKGPSSSGGVEASHLLFGLDLFTGKVELSQPAMPSAGEDPRPRGHRLRPEHRRLSRSQRSRSRLRRPDPGDGGPLDYFQVGGGRDRGAVWMGRSLPDSADHHNRGRVAVVCPRALLEVEVLAIT